MVRRESLQLGMNYSSAQHRLKKLFMFSMAQKLDLDICIRCGLKLEALDFTLDHKIQWLDNDVSLFWNLENLGFAHSKCNTIAKVKKEVDVTAEMVIHLNKIRKDFIKNCPEGMCWCCGHQQHLPVEEFGKDKSKPTGLHPYCRKCRSERKY